MPFTTVTNRAGPHSSIIAEHHNEIVDYLGGARTELTRLYSADDAQYGVTIKNSGAGSKGLLVQDEAGVTLLDVSSAGTILSVAPGTDTAPGFRFGGDPNTGARWIEADHWALVAGGGLANGGDLVRMRAGTKYPQVGMGTMNIPGGWDWGPVAPGCLVHIQKNEDLAAGGDTIGLTSSITSAASSGGAGVVPDSSAASLFFFQSTAGHNGAGRALEAHASRTTTGGGHAFASLYAAELAISSIMGGNGTDKIGGFHMLGTDDTGGSGVRLDVGGWIRGSSGFTHYLRCLDETPLAQGVLFDIDFQGLATIYGGIDITGPVRFISASWDSTVALANQTRLRSRNINQPTTIPVVPNGNATTASIAAHTAESPTNASFLKLEAAFTRTTLESGRSGSGSYLPLDIRTSGAVAATVGTGGEVFVANAGVVPSTNPVGGGYLYVQAGSLKFRGSSGTVTSVAPA